ncbi:MAG: Fic family protein [Candidatus Methanomethyliaceae archaeon]
MDTASFVNPSGRLVFRGRTAHFVPNDLPQTLTFSSRVINLLSKADRVIGELNGISGHIDNPHLITRLFTRKEAVMSSRIEGTQTNFRDLLIYEFRQKLLFEADTDHTPRSTHDSAASDAREVMNYVFALDEGLNKLQTFPISLRLIKDLHRRLLSGVRGGQANPGEFRHTTVWIGHPGSTIDEARFVPPPSDVLLDVLDTFERSIYRNDELPPLIKIAMLHQYFETIHPFLDGNGRIGRLLISLLMQSNGLLSQPLLYMSGYFESHREQYYDLLLDVSKTSNWMLWLEFFLTGVEYQGRDAIERARRLDTLRRTYHEMFDRPRTPAGLDRTIDDLFATPIINAQSVMAARNITWPMASEYIRRLVDAGILEPLDPSRRRYRLFVATGIMEAVEAANSLS